MKLNPSQCGATISKCGLYRYRLWRGWGEQGGVGWTNPLTVLARNPSTADASLPDPTINVECGWASRHGYDGLDKYNIQAFRAADPAMCPAGLEGFGPANERYLTEVALFSPAVVVAWGASADPLCVAKVVDIFRDCGTVMLCWGVNADGSPRHPLRRKLGELHVWHP